MGLIELVLLAVGLSMDAFAVSICKGLETGRTTPEAGLICGIWFGGFQGLMPFVGFICGSGFETMIAKVAPWVAFVLLAAIGINMLREAFSKREDETRPGFSPGTMLMLAVATSIDALAVGVAFVAVPAGILDASVFTNTVAACILIMMTTFIISVLGVRIGSIFGAAHRRRAEVAGGLVLILIGIRILLEHMYEVVQ